MGRVSLEETNSKIQNGIFSCEYIIKDNGCGMSIEFQKKLFMPFEREKTQEAYMGTGLGLAITKQIVDLMGGTIRIESEEEKGTSVFIKLDIPIATPEQVKENGKVYKPVEMITTNEKNKNILIVEDHPLNQEIVCRVLQKQGYKTECVSNGQEAVSKMQHCEEDAYQAILMDIRMPIMDGLTATKKIRELPSEYAKTIPIIAMTANAFDEDVRDCLEAGMNEHLSKPIIPSKLYETLSMYLGKSEKNGH